MFDVSFGEKNQSYCVALVGPVSIYRQPRLVCYSMYRQSRLAWWYSVYRQPRLAWYSGYKQPRLAWYSVYRQPRLASGLQALRQRPKSQVYQCAHLAGLDIVIHEHFILHDSLPRPTLITVLLLCFNFSLFLRNSYMTTMKYDQVHLCFPLPCPPYPPTCLLPTISFFLPLLTVLPDSNNSQVQLVQLIWGHPVEKVFNSFLQVFRICCDIHLYLLLFTQLECHKSRQ